jgi:hypothetical protein
MNNAVNALAVYDDGTGPALYAGGSFSLAGGVPALRIAKWNGTSWSSVGAIGANGTPSNDAVRALAVFNPGSGPRLYAAGQFATADGVTVNNIARWTGSAWSPLGAGGAGLSNYAQALSVFDDGNGPALFAGGWFTAAGSGSASYIARWNGTNWSALGNGIQFSGVNALAAGNDALYAGGAFVLAGGSPSAYWARYGCQACYPNCDASTASPVLNVADFVCFLNRYAASDPYANCDGSTMAPVLNVADFICFMGAYAAGCP